MSYNPNFHHRQSLRLKNYDYSQAGAYFVTICIQNKECLLGDINHEGLTLNQYGRMVEQIWQFIPQHFKDVEIDVAIVMPDHFHGIIVIENKEESNEKEVIMKHTLGQVVAYFKYQTTKQINRDRDTAGIRLWQRNYYEHIIRNELSLEMIRDYIIQNPTRWKVVNSSQTI